MLNNAKKIENELDKEFKKTLVNLNPEEFEEYFKQLIEKYYSVAFTFEEDYSKYYEATKKKYKIIKEVKSILASKYNNLDNYENSVRLGKAEDIAYKQMLEINSMETSYSNIIYHYKTQELIFINTTLAKLVELYKEDPNEKLLATIEDVFSGTVISIKEAKKLPLYEKEELFKDVTFKKEHFKNLSETEKEELPEVFEETILTKPFLSLELKQQLEKFEAIVEDLEKILPDHVIIDFNLRLNSSEKIDFLNFLLETKTEEESEEEIYKTVAYIDYLKNKNDKQYLYNIIESWS